MEWKELGAEENNGMQLKYKEVKGEWRVKGKMKEIGENNEMGKDIILTESGISRQKIVSDIKLV